MARRLSAALTLLVATGIVLAGCGGGGDPSDPADGGAGGESAAPIPGSSPTGDASATSEPGGGDTGGPAADEAVMPGATLIGTVGTEEDPDAFEITLTDESGAPVSSLPAGDYTLTINDLSSMHNFHLTGPGEVDVMSEVDAIDTTTVEITVVPGTYAFVCDPHPERMTGEVEVTG
jgi:hypothetical protein